MSADLISGLRDEVASIRAQNAALSSQVSHLFAKNESLYSSLQGQQRNTLAFKAERDSLASALEAAVARIASVRDESVEECLAHIDYVKENIVVNWPDRQRFDRRHVNQAFKGALTIARERITGEDADKWTAPPAPKQEGPNLPAAEKPERRGGHGTPDA